MGHHGRKNGEPQVPSPSFKNDQSLGLHHWGWVVVSTSHGWKLLKISGELVVDSYIDSLENAKDDSMICNFATVGCAN